MRTHDCLYFVAVFGRDTGKEEYISVSGFNVQFPKPFLIHKVLYERLTRGAVRSHCGTMSFEVEQWSLSYDRVPNNSILTNYTFYWSTIKTVFKRHVSILSHERGYERGQVFNNGPVNMGPVYGTNKVTIPTSDH